MSGFAWRYHLPDNTRNLHINTIEFLAALVGIWLETLHDAASFKILYMADNSSALAWLHKGNFHSKDKKIHKKISRKLARILFHLKSSLYSQHVLGKQNIIADSLSRDHHIPSTHLNYSLTSLSPTHTGAHFKISDPLPQEITSWIDSLMAESTGARYPKSWCKGDGRVRLF